MKIEVFECKSGVSKAGNNYNIVLARVDEHVGRVFSDVALPNGTVDVELEMGVSRDLFFTPRIKSFKPVS